MYIKLADGYVQVGWSEVRNVFRVYGGEWEWGLRYTGGEVQPFLRTVDGKTIAIKKREGKREDIQVISSNPYGKLFKQLLPLGDTWHVDIDAGDEVVCSRHVLAALLGEKVTKEGWVESAIAINQPREPIWEFIRQYPHEEGKRCISPHCVEFIRTIRLDGPPDTQILAKRTPHSDNATIDCYFSGNHIDQLLALDLFKGVNYKWNITIAWRTHKETVGPLSSEACAAIVDALRFTHEG
mgnify:CR=1 FL=1